MKKLLFIFWLMTSALPAARLSLPQASGIQAAWVFDAVGVSERKEGFEIFYGANEIWVAAAEGYLVSASGRALRVKSGLEDFAWVKGNLWASQGEKLGLVEGELLSASRKLPVEKIYMRQGGKGLYLWGKAKNKWKAWYLDLSSKKRKLAVLLESSEKIYDAFGNGHEHLLSVGKRLLKLAKNKEKDQVLLQASQVLRQAVRVKDSVVFATTDRVGVITDQGVSTLVEGKGARLEVFKEILWIGFAPESSLMKVQGLKNLKNLKKQALKSIAAKKIKKQKGVKIISARIKAKSAKKKKIKKEKKIKLSPQKQTVKLPAYAHDWWLESAWTAYSDFGAPRNMEDEFSALGLQHEDRLLPLSLQGSLRWKRFVLGYQYVDLNSSAFGTTGTTSSMARNQAAEFYADVISLGYDLTFKPLDRLGPVELYMPLRLEIALLESEFLRFNDEAEDGGDGLQMLWRVGMGMRWHFGRVALKAEALYHLQGGGSPTLFISDQRSEMPISLDGLDLRVGLSIALD